MTSVVSRIGVTRCALIRKEGSTVPVPKDMCLEGEIIGLRVWLVRVRGERKRAREREREGERGGEMNRVRRGGMSEGRERGREGEREEEGAGKRERESRYQN